MDIYERLGVKKIINGWGTVTKVGGSLIDEEVLRAMEEASQSYVVMEEFHRKAGERIARLLGVEGACITAGAAAAIAVSAAACMTEGDPAKALKLPNTDGMRNQALMLKCHRTLYDQALPMTGIQIKETGVTSYADVHQVEEAIDERTAMFFYVAEAEMMRGSVPVEEIIEVMHRHKLPVVVDAAAEIPPVENVTKYLEKGADMVIFSGGKEIRGPQASGLIVGKKSWIEACMANCCPQYSIGRPMKIDKETIAGLVQAVDLFKERDYEKRLQHWNQISIRMKERLEKVPSVKVWTGYPTEPGVQPIQILRLFVKPLCRPAEQVYKDLTELDRPVYVLLHGDELIINPQCLAEEEAEALCDSLIMVCDKSEKGRQ